MITDLLRERATESPDKAFVITTEGEYSFRRIDDAARRFANQLESLGVGAGDHVALIAENCAAFLVAWFGVNYRGAVVVTLNNQLVAQGLRYSLDQCDARLIIADRAWVDARSQQLDARQAAMPRIVIESDAHFFASLDDLEPAQPVPVGEDQACAILYTSGTTGLPKGVVNCHGAYLACGRATVDALQISAADRIMVFLPLFHVNPQMYAVMSALITGASLILLKRFSASSFFDDAIRFGATGCTFVGTVLSILVARHADERRDHGLRFCFGGGAPRDVWQTVQSRYGIQVHEAYGMTEIGGWSTANTVDDARFGSCGRARPDLDIRIVDAQDNELPSGQQGEIVVRPRAPNVILLGYYKKPEQMLASCRNLWFHTGDLGSIDADGYLFYHGRLKELIRRSGEMISPVEIETCLRRMPSVRDCAVVAVPDAIVGDEIKAVLVCDAPIAAASVREFLRPLLPAFMLPRYVEFLDAIPKTETEKIQRNKLQYLGQGVHDLAGAAQPSPVSSPSLASGNSPESGRSPTLSPSPLQSAPPLPFQIALAGFGEVGQAYARALLGQGARVCVYHPHASAHTRAAAAAMGLPIISDAAASLGACAVVLSVVPAAAASQTARAAAAVLRPGALFADLSSASPAIIRASAALFAPAAYVDVAIMGAVSIHGLRTPLLASGPGASALNALLQAWGFQIESLVDSVPGDASALKLLRSVFTKGMDAVVIECLLAAQAAGLRQPLLAQMGDLDRSTTRELIEMFVRTHVPAAPRRLHETQAVVEQLAELGVDSRVTRAVQARYERTVALMGEDARNPPVPPGGTVFDAVLPWMLARERASDVG